MIRSDSAGRPGTLATRPVLVFVFTALMSGSLVYAGRARASIFSTVTAASACLGTPGIKTDSTGGVTTTASGTGASYTTDCGFDSMSSVRDLSTVSYFEVDGEAGLPFGAATSAKLCAHDYTSSTSTCGTAAVSPVNVNYNMSVSDLSAWTAGNGWYPFVHLSIGYSTNPVQGSHVWGFYFTTN